MATSAFDCLAVTKVNVYPHQKEINGIRAIAKVVLNDQLIINGIEVCHGEAGNFIAFPKIIGAEQRSVFPLTEQLREHIENCVLEKYQAEVDPLWDWEVVVRHPELDNVELTIQVKAEDDNSAVILACNKAREIMPNLMSTAWEVKTREKLT